jgi:AhpD family alkylhydroperoxidase
MKQRIDARADASHALSHLVALHQTLTETFDKTLRHLIDVRVSLMNECHFCINMHTKEALDGGDTQERVSALTHWQISSLFTEREKAALAWAEALTRQAAQPEIEALHADLERHFTSEEIATLTIAIAAIIAWNRIGIASYRH